MINFDNCPICDSETDRLVKSGKCPNGCFKYYNNDTMEHIAVNIFDKHFTIPSDKEQIHNRISSREYYVLLLDLERLTKTIKYWKKDDRYLTEILSGVE